MSRAEIPGLATVAAPEPEIVRDPRSQALLPLVYQISLHCGAQKLFGRSVPELDVQPRHLPCQCAESLVFSIARERRIHILICVHLFIWRKCQSRVSRQDACNQEGV